MNLLAFDTSTETLSIAVSRDVDGQPRVWAYEGAGGAQASASLIPQVMALLGEAGLRLPDLAAIAFGRGPGSFTGLRTACSVAQGLAFGAALPVLPIDTLLAVAEEARHATGAGRVLATLDARMDEVYAASFIHEQGRWRQDGETGLLRPEALAVGPGWTLAGNIHAAYGARLAEGLAVVPALPTAAALLRLAPSLLAAGHAVPPAQALPLYVRDKVAKTTAERAAALPPPAP